MAIQIEYPYIDELGQKHYDQERRYSDKGVYLRQIESGYDGYESAVDYIPCRYTYEETDEPIDPVDPTEAEYVQAMIDEAL